MAVRDVVQAAAGVGGEASDENFSNVTLLLQADTENTANNNTFLDSSTNNFTITRNGNITQGTFSPYGENWSNYFDGNGDYLTRGNNVAFDFGTGDFTLECWVFITASPDNMPLVSWGTGSYKIIRLNPTSLNVESNIPSNISFNVSFPSSLVLNNWNHIALVRSGNSFTSYLNGVGGTPYTYTGSIGNSSDPFNIGYKSDPNYFSGHLSNLRVVKGTALYTTNFTPSTTPLTAVSGTSLLTCQSNRFKDNSTNNFAITAVGTPSVQRFSPFAPTDSYDPATIGGSGYFDGATGNYLVTSSSFPTIGSGDYCINFWTYPKRTTPAAGVFELGQYDNGMLVRATPGYAVEVWINGTQIATGNALNLNAWNYVCIFRESGWTYIFVNGVQEAASTSHSGLSVSSFPAKIGTTQHSNYYENQYGFLSDLRVNVGTTSIPDQLRDPPTAPISGISNTQLLTKFQNAGIIDNAMMNDLETVGNAQVSTSVVKYGTGSMAFDGNDCLSAPSSPNYAFGTGDYTIEAWVYPTSVRNGENLIYAVDVTGGTTFGYNQTQLYIGARATAYDLQVSYAMPTSTWTHVAASRQNGTVRIFANGTLVGSGSVTRSCPQGSAGVGDYPTLPNNGVIGYIDDLRITKGIARYTANFTPPNAALLGK